MATAFEKTVSATEFKAKCLDLMAQVHSGELRRIHITKRGKPFVAVLPDSDGGADEKPWTAESIFGCMKGSVNIPADYDWEVPLYSDADRAEQEARFEEKFQHLL